MKSPRMTGNSSVCPFPARPLESVMFLLDTDVISALRRRDRNPELVLWLDTQRTTDLYLSVVTVGRDRAGHHSATAARSFIRPRASHLAGPSPGLVRRPNCPNRHRHRTPLGSVVGNPWTLGSRPAYRRHSPRTRPDRHHPQRPPLRSNWSPGNQSLRMDVLVHLS